ncbi:HD domain-containing protein [Tissierella praeacuta]|uniref:HD domain-containing protein n=1 Tax=Tissierella praeacuta TaxID=43131 RepID=UPI00289F36E2|nr:HD domain-containing protein [Tissierella praeacuta]
MLIGKYEKNVDLEVLIPSALLHDIARVEESKDKTGELDHAILGSEIEEDILRRLQYEEEKIERIKHCIIAHRFRTGNEPNTIINCIQKRLKKLEKKDLNLWKIILIG